MRVHQKGGAPEGYLLRIVTRMLDAAQDSKLVVLEYHPLAEQNSAQERL
jgi:hypothetical protein